jgi:hypothetical protein
MMVQVSDNEPAMKVVMMVRPPDTWWRRNYLPTWRPKSWLGMAISNRLYEWHWTVSHKVHALLEYLSGHRRRV